MGKFRQTFCFDFVQVCRSLVVILSFTFTDYDGTKLDNFWQIDFGCEYCFGRRSGCVTVCLLSTGSNGDGLQTCYG